MNFKVHKKTGKNDFQYIPSGATSCKASWVFLYYVISFFSSVMGNLARRINKEFNIFAHSINVLKFSLSVSNSHVEINLTENRL